MGDQVVRVLREESFQTSGAPATATLVLGHVSTANLTAWAVAWLATDAGQAAIRAGVRAELRAELETIRDDARKVDLDTALRWAVERLSAAPREPAQDGGSAETGTPQAPPRGAAGAAACSCGTQCRLADLMRKPAQDEPAGCNAGRDGECNWRHCPQLRDGEPEKTGRHCPLDRDDDDEPAAPDARAAGFAEGVEAAAKLISQAASDYFAGDARFERCDVRRTLADKIRALTPPTAAPDPLLPGFMAARERMRASAGTWAAGAWSGLRDWLDAEIARRGGA